MGCGGGNKNAKTVNIDFEDKEPGESGQEKDVYDKVKPLLDRTSEILEQLKGYTGCAEYIKLAVRTPSTENDITAWNAVVPAVNMLKDFFDYYSAFKDGLLKLLIYVSKEDPKTVLQENLGVTRLIVSMLDFIIKFDELKMGKASIQNDFSFYRRSMNRMKRGAVELNVSSPPVNDEVANRMSLFFAYPNPFTKALIDELQRNKDIPRDELVQVFGLIANACKENANKNESNDPTRKEKNFVLFRSMVAAIMFYDYTSPVGVFVGKSEVDVEGCIQALKKYHNESTDLLNTIRYGTKTFNNDTTPKKIINLMS